MLKIGQLVRVRPNLGSRYRGKTLVAFGGQIGTIVSIDYNNRIYGVCSDMDDPVDPWRATMWHDRFTEFELVPVNEEAIALEVLGDGYFA